MAEKPANNDPEKAKEVLDLNTLSGLDFGPNWADDTKKPHRQKNFHSDKRDKRSSGPGGPRDRRQSGGRPPTSDRRAGGDRPRGRGNDRGGPRSAPKPFEATVKVDLYPQDEAFEALVNRLRSSARTYQLFDIAQLLLEKPDRFVVVVSPKRSGGTDGESGGESTPLYFSMPGHLPFKTEDEAINYVLANHIEQFFDVESIEVEPPKGNFPMVNRCTITGALLGPPNYHRYQEFVQRHYAARISGMSFERFTSKIEGVRDQEQIDAWLESMKQGARYSVKDRKEGEPESFETLEAARHFLVQHRKDQVVASGESVRFAGRDIERIPPSDIRRSVEAYIEDQRHFPLDSANNIRGRLRRHKFAVYKKGSKGVSFVCAVKRKFRESQTVFTDSISDLIDFIEKHPDIPASKLPKEYIGIDTEKQKPEKLKMTEAEVEAAAQAKAAEAKATEEANTAPSEGGKEAAEGKETETPAPAGQANVAATQPTQPTQPTVSPDATASTEATPKESLSQEEQSKLRQLMLDLRWLITEGYVTEYGDGRLFAPPPMPDAKPKDREPSAPKVKTAEPASKSTTETTTETIAEAKDTAPESLSETNSKSAPDERGE